MSRIRRRIRFRFRCIYLVILQTQETSAKTKFGCYRTGHLEEEDTGGGGGEEEGRGGGGVGEYRI